MYICAVLIVYEIMTLLQISEFGNDVGSLGWTSFGKIAMHLIFIGFALRSIIVLRSAISGEGNLVGSFVRLLASIIGILLIRAFMI